MLANVFVNTILCNNAQIGCLRFFLSGNMRSELFEKYLQNNRSLELIMDQPTNPLRLPRCNYNVKTYAKHLLFKIFMEIPRRRPNNNIAAHASFSINITSEMVWWGLL